MVIRVMGVIMRMRVGMAIRLRLVAMTVPVGMPPRHRLQRLENGVSVRVGDLFALQHLAQRDVIDHPQRPPAGHDFTGKMQVPDLPANLRAFLRRMVWNLQNRLWPLIEHVVITIGQVDDGAMSQAMLQVESEFLSILCRPPPAPLGQR